MDGPVRMTPLTWVAGAFRAQVLAARLESEGIDAQLRGALDSPYGLTMGDMARVDVYVPEDQLDDAKYVLLFSKSGGTLGLAQINFTVTPAKKLAGGCEIVAAGLALGTITVAILAVPPYGATAVVS